MLRIISKLIYIIGYEAACIVVLFTSHLFILVKKNAEIKVK